MKPRKDDPLLYPGEIVEIYRELCEDLNWDEQTIGVFYKANLLEGEFYSSKNKARIRVSSFLKLVDYVTDRINNKLANIHKHKKTG